MQRDADTFISNNDREFVLKALKEEHRLDGRRPYDYRKVKFQFSLDDSSASVTLGTTRVMTVVTATLEKPFPDRPNEGALRFNVEMGPMASPAFEAGRPGIDAIELMRLIERGLKQSHAIDTEALCVLAGSKVWSLRVDTHVLDHGGNLVDAAFLSALAALMVFRKPEVTIGGENKQEVIIQPKEVKEPTPLSIHHHPIAITFALFEDGSLVAVDPSLREEASCAGRATIAVNTAREVCAVHKADGIGLSSSQFMRLVRLACTKADELMAELRSALEAHEVARVQARVRRTRMAVGLPQPGRNVVVSGAEGQQQGAAAGGSGQEAAQKLAQEIGIDLDAMSSDDDDEEGSSSSSSGEEDEEGGDMEVEEHQQQQQAAAAAGSAPAAREKHAGASGQQKQQQKQGALKLVAAAAAVPSKAHAAGSGKAGQGKPKAGSQQAQKRAAPAAPALQQDDTLEAIAAIIAGGSSSSGAAADAKGDVAELTDAIKMHKLKPKQQGAKKQKK